MPPHIKKVTLLSAFFAVLIGTATLFSAQKPKPTAADYGQWETLTIGALSPDGKWLAHGINRTSGKHELRVAGTSGDMPSKVIAFCTEPAFSIDSRWLACGIGLSEAEEEKLKKENKPVQRKLALLELRGGDQTTIDAVASFAFSGDGGYLAMRRYPPERPKREAPEPAAGTESQDPEGVTIVIRDLAKGIETAFGNVSEFSWQDRGHLLALSISAQQKVGNGLHVFDAATGQLRVLDSGAAIYTGLTWRKHDDDLVVLRSKTDDRHDDPTHVVLAWHDLSSASNAKRTYDPTGESAFPKGSRIVKFRKPAWSDDGAVIFLGVAPWRLKTPPTKPTTETTSQNPAGNSDSTSTQSDKPDKPQQEAKTRPKERTEAEEDPAGVDVWHARDVSVMPKQKIDAPRDREKNFLAAWDVQTGAFRQLGDEQTEQVVPIKRQRLAYGVHTKPYDLDRSFGRRAADVYLIDIGTGERARIKERFNEQYVNTSPGGRYLLYFVDDHFWTFDVRSRRHANISKSIPTSFADRLDDHPVPQKPPYGIAGWTKDDTAVIVHDQFDLWELSSDGSKARRLTDGAGERVRHRYLRLDPEEEWIDPARPLYVRLFGTWSKRSGYGRLRLTSPEPKVERLVWLDKSVDRLIKAKDADVYAYVVQSFDDSPDYVVGGADLHGGRQLTQTNPFQSDYAWGRAELIEYKSARGDPLQGALLYPADYEAGKRYPMITYVYERRSDELHRYSSPSERQYYNTTVFTLRGYVVLLPDIAFRPRNPGLSVVECVLPAVRKVIGMGVVDERRVGVVGHSWGGFDTAFLATHTDVFAAAVAGAPITNLVSNYGSHHWSAGIAETDHIELGQQRMEVPLWEDVDAYIRNSAVFGVHTMKTPLLIAFGDKDGTVDWSQGVELYNIARRARKQVVFLVYGGEDHGLRKKANQVDYHRRILDWFGHYLQGEPAPEWITKGVSYLDREKELKDRKRPAPSAPPLGGF